MERRRKNEIPSFKTTSSASPDFYLDQILPKLKQSKVIGLIITNGGALQDFYTCHGLKYIYFSITLMKTKEVGIS
ncbi:hypothetical protein Ahy_A02g008476 isoform B [Arachis hypogaea]|uniref:Uncharacterized protein n=1 Tax=Arachis hypogaea TaxID=3818 RepID=A0A445EF14_ARAHY|nr:hypothetical protein Ahy_A02g008476 isoform B [Arachis hypogaea]